MKNGSLVCLNTHAHTYNVIILQSFVIRVVVVLPFRTYLILGNPNRVIIQDPGMFEDTPVRWVIKLNECISSRLSRQRIPFDSNILD